MRRPIVILCLAALGCAPAALPPGDAAQDPYEGANRRMHDFNLALFGAAAGGGDGVPDPVLRAADNVGTMLGEPSNVVNDVLQGRPGDAMHNASRFVLNATVGVFGLFDTAAAMGLEERDTDFGETLHVWGVPEGDYVVLPGLGPSTTRDATGMAVDLFLNPLGYIGQPERTVLGAARLGGEAAGRLRYADDIEQLAASEDSYLALRSAYLQNRRFELGGGDLDYIDPYEDPYALDQ